MTPIALADNINTNASKVLNIVLANGGRPRLAILARTLDLARRISDELRPYIASGVEIESYSPEILTMPNIRGRTRVGVVLVDGLQLDNRELYFSFDRSLTTCARILQCTTRSLITNEFGDSV
jgi:hypothetical protein